MPISKDKILFDLDLTEKLSKIPRAKRSQAKTEAAAVLQNAILGDLSASKSPVTGARFKGLTKEYRKEKKKQGKPGVPNLELLGDMLSNLRVKNSKKGIKAEVVGKEKLKAFNHNVGDTLPKRQFIPDDAAQGATSNWRRSILNEIDKVLDKFTKEE